MGGAVESVVATTPSCTPTSRALRQFGCFTGAIFLGGFAGAVGFAVI
jgi:hypothetical protein